MRPFTFLLIGTLLLKIAILRSDIICVPENVQRIQEAINLSNTGDTVLVAEGWYFENINFRGKSITLASYYLVDADTSHIARTIIDGSKPIDPDSGSTVMFVSGEDTSTVLCGFRIIGGHGTMELNTLQTDYLTGGGIYCRSGGSILNNIIEQNSLISQNYLAVGSGISAGTYGKSSWVIIKDNKILQNVIDARQACGGGIFFLSHVKIINNKIVGNHLSSNEVICAGSGICGIGRPADRIQCFIQKNQIQFNTCHLNSSECNHKATGGGIDLTYANARICRNIIMQNQLISDSEGGGAGINLFVCNSQIKQNIISQNQINASGNSLGGGINNCFTQSEISNNVICQNSALKGGGIRIHHQNSQVRLINNTLISNSSLLGGSAVDIYNSYVEIMNSIIWNNPGNVQIFRNGGSILINYSNIQGNWAGVGNISFDPEFMDKTYCLKPLSLCIDSGNPDPEYDDPQDPNRFQMALWPSQGTLRNDIGAYGGPECIQLISNDPVGYRSDHKTSITNWVLYQNFPNPYNPSTIISWQLAVGGPVKVSIYDLLGKEVAVLVNEKQAAGFHQVEFEASNLASGIYIYRLVTEGFVETRKMVLMR